MRSRSSVGDRRRRCALLVVTSVLAACAGCGQLAPPGMAPAGALAHPPPPAEVVALAAAMSPEGKEVFYATRPKLLDRAEIASECTEDEALGVLGCYSDGRIFILRVTRPELAGIMEVTAAHEMLHAVFDHLPPGERLRIERSVDDLYRSADSPRLRESLAAYEGLGSDDRLDELHSILGTEAVVLSSSLVEHYGRFFDVRQRILEANDRIQSLFEALESQIDGLIAEAERLEGPINTLEARLNADEAALEALDRRLGDLRAAGNAAGYSRLLPERNRLARTLEEGIDQHDKMVDEYNAKVDQIDALALEEDKLISALEERDPPGP